MPFAGSRPHALEDHHRSCKQDETVADQQKDRRAARRHDRQLAHHQPQDQECEKAHDDMKESSNEGYPNAGCELRFSSQEVGCQRGLAVTGRQGVECAETEGEDSSEETAGAQLGSEPDHGRTLKATQGGNEPIRHARVPTVDGHRLNNICDSIAA